MKWLTTRYPGIVTKHKLIGPRGDTRPCPGDEGGRCRCTPSYRVRYRNAEGKPKWSKVMHDLSEARSWQTGARNVTPEVAATRTADTFKALSTRFIDGARAGTITQRNGERYAPRTVDIYEATLRRHVYPTFGARLASVLNVIDWQLYVDGLHRAKLSHNSIVVVMNAVRSVYRWACAPSRRLLTSNETRGIEMPAKDEKKRDRIAPPEEARALLAALSQPCDVLDYGLALYAGLRNCERWGLEWTDIALTNLGGDTQDRDHGAEGVGRGSPSAPFGRSTRRASCISIRRVTTKSKAGVRTLPVIGRLRPILMREWLRQGKPENGPVLVYPNGGRGENAYKSQCERCEKAWVASNLKRITPHEARHTFASYLIASGLNAKAVTVLMGHASVTETFDRYGHLFPGHEDEAGGLLDALLGLPETERETEAVSV